MIENLLHDIYIFSGDPVSWKTKKQSSVALSTAEAEFTALASSAQEAVWMRQLSSEIVLSLQNQSLHMRIINLQ